ncbi:MAG: DUF3352 domain-containing protein, partial [Bacteroidales bacterium]|nr:DUF3352 domain-containing protein [Bacteroidales bacterium]
RVGFSGSRKGLFTLMQPADRKLFQIADPCCTEAVSWHWDYDATFELILKCVTVVDANAPALVDKALNQAQENTGIAIRTDLLQNLTGAMAFSNVPAGIYPDAFMGGGVVVAQLKDAAAFETALAKFGEYLQEQLQGQLSVSSSSGEQGTIHTWTVPSLMMLQMIPTWMVVDDLWILASNMPLCERAALRWKERSHAKGMLVQKESFRALMSQVPKNAFMIEYSDTKAQYQQLLQAAQQFWPMIAMSAMQEGVTVPTSLPNLNHLIEDLKPTYSYGSVTPQSIEMRFAGPQAQLYSVAGAAMGMGIVMPALARTRQLAERMESGKNLAAIGKACLIYANEHDDQMPLNLQVLVEEEYLDARFLESKLCEEAPGPDYIYIPKQRISDDLQNVVAYENPDKLKRPDEGCNILFLDSHVEFVKGNGLEQLLEETYERLGDRAP